MKNIIFAILYLTFNISLLYSEVIRTPEVVSALMAKRFSSMRGFSARFTERNGSKIYSGQILYKTPNKFKLTYNERSNSHQIVSNGETLWIYLPKIRVVSEQDVSGNVDGSALYTSSGVNRLLREYNFNFYDKREPVAVNSFDDNNLQIEGYDSSSYTKNDRRLAYHMLLTPKKPSVDRTGFIRIHLWVDRNGMIIRMLGVSTTRTPVEYLFWDINYSDIYSDEAFNLDIPPNVQVLKNDLVPR